MLKFKFEFQINLDISKVLITLSNFVEVYTLVV